MEQIDRQKAYLQRVFRNNSDCYADTMNYEDGKGWQEGETIQAMTEEKFVELVNKLLNEREPVHTSV